MAREDFLEDFPDTAEILRYIQESPTPVDKRDIARAFNLKGAQRRRLREVLADLQEAGKLADKGKKKLAPPDRRLPPVGVVEVSDIDEDGELCARPANWPEEAGPTAAHLPGRRQAQPRRPGGRRPRPGQAGAGRAGRLRRQGHPPHRPLAGNGCWGSTR